MMLVCSLYLHDARLEYVADTSLKSEEIAEVGTNEVTHKDITLLSTVRHIHVSSTSLPGGMASYSTSLASAQPRNKENEDKYVAQNKLVCNTYGNNAK
jgi:hypothetical protein